MPRTRAQTRRDSLFDLAALPDELLQHAALLLLADDLQSLPRLRRASQGLKQRLTRVWRQALARRLQWQPTKSTRCEISNSGRTVAHAGGDVWGHMPWCGASLLPTAGRSRWRVCIDATDSGAMYIGVCHDPISFHARSVGWGLNPETGLVQQRFLSELSPTSAGMITCADSPPAGFPGIPVSGPPIGLERAAHTEIEMQLDHDAGILDFYIAGRHDAGLRVAGFPRGAALRPWVRIRDSGDVVSLQGWWSSV